MPVVLVIDKAGKVTGQRGIETTIFNDDLALASDPLVHHLPTTFRSISAASANALDRHPPRYVPPGTTQALTQNWAHSNVNKFAKSVPAVLGIASIDAEEARMREIERQRALQQAPPRYFRVNDGDLLEGAAK